MSYRDPGDFARNQMTPEQVQLLLRMATRLFIGVPIVLLLIWGSFSSFYTVQPEERGVVLRFGRFYKVSDPGLHFKLPFGIDSVQTVATERVLKQEFGFRTVRPDVRTQYDNTNFDDESLMLTGDLNVIDVSWVVQYRISDPEKYLFRIQDPTDTLRDVSEAVMRRIVGNRLGSDVLTTGRVEIATQARAEIQEIMESYDSGILVSTVELQDVVPPARVQPAFNDVNISRQAREQMINEAEKRRNQKIPRTQGEANQQIAEGEGYAVERVNRAKGETARFLAILAEYEAAPEVTRQRLYLETIDRVLPNAGNVVVVQDDSVGPIPLLNLDPAGGPVIPGQGVQK